LEHASAIAVTDLVCCPRCEGRLDRGPPPACGTCDTRYPVVDGIPWLCCEPDALLGEWRSRLRALTTELEAQSARYRASLTDEVIRPETRNRLKLLSSACLDHARRLKSLLAPLGVPAAAASLETYRALSGALPAGQGLTGYYANLHRDWYWGDPENEAAYQAVATALGESNPGRTLVLGAGGGRLAFDLHLRRQPAVTVAADLNPLMLAVARRMFMGESVELYEFPVAPRDLASHAVLRRLRAPAPAPAGLHVVLADATRAPFAQGAFDTIVTPWLVDILDEDFAVFAARIHRWLRPGGRWINSGSLFFQHPDPACRYSTEEVLAIVGDAGFAGLEASEAVVPYLASPASRHARQERLFTFRATRDTQDRPAPRTHAAVPDWVTRNDRPVPLLPEVSSRVLAMRVYAFVASLVDGRRTLRDIAEVLVRERLMTADEAEPAVRAFLQRLFDEAQASSKP
jgi:hypothetical protein